jgi:hypothetical protein
MKNILLISALAFISLNPALSQKRGYEKSFQLGIAPDFVFDDANLNIAFVNGFRANRAFFFGGGIGITGKYFMSPPIRISYPDGGRSYTQIDPSVYLSVPVFAKLKINLSKTRVSPFLSADAGYNIPMEDEPDDVRVGGSFILLSTGFDVNLGLKRVRAFYFQAGIYMQENKNLLTWDLSDGEYVNLDVRIGYRF